MLPTFSQNFTLQEAFETVAHINEELKITEFDGAFCKKIQTSKAIDFLHFFGKRRKLLEKLSHQKKTRDHLARCHARRGV